MVLSSKEFLSDTATLSFSSSNFISDEIASLDGAVTGLGDRLFMSLVGVAIIDLNLKFAGPRVALSVQITCRGIQIFVNGIILQNAWLNYYNPNI